MFPPSNMGPPPDLQAELDSLMDFGSGQDAAMTGADFSRPPRQQLHPSPPPGMPPMTPPVGAPGPMGGQGPMGPQGAMNMGPAFGGSPGDMVGPQGVSLGSKPALSDLATNRGAMPFKRTPKLRAGSRFGMV